MAHASQDLMGWSKAADLKRQESQPVFRSDKSHVLAPLSVDVNVELKLDTKDVDVEAMVRELQSAINRPAGPSADKESLLRMTRSVMKEVIEAGLERGLAREFDNLVAAYREMLERRVASGHDEAISRALTRAKLQTEVLSSVPMVDQAEACTLLGLSDANPSATLKRYEVKGRILRFDWRGKVAYPLFQFDVSERRIHPTLLKIMEMRTDDWGGNMALLHWLTRPNRNLGGARPCDRLADDADAILHSFAAELAEPLNG